eukprot:scaffold29342_cov72-Skeletonema_dohrnii-CCMP3373.AAC.2
MDDTIKLNFRKRSNDNAHHCASIEMIFEQKCMNLCKAAELLKKCDEHDSMWLLEKEKHKKVKHITECNLPDNAVLHSVPCDMLLFQRMPVAH